MSAYFATDGNYGSAHGLFIVDTTHWTTSDWDTVDMASDYDRASVALEIVQRYSGVGE